MGVARFQFFENIVTKAKQKLQESRRSWKYCFVIHKEAIFSSFSFKGNLQIYLRPFFCMGYHRIFASQWKHTQLQFGSHLEWMSYHGCCLANRSVLLTLVSFSVQWIHNCLCSSHLTPPPPLMWVLGGRSHTLGHHRQLWLQCSPWLLNQLCERLCLGLG